VAVASERAGVAALDREQRAETVVLDLVQPPVTFGRDID
jgi:hypothetical protein